MKRKLSSLIAAVFIGIGAFSCICQAAGMDIDKEDGEYSIQVDLEGGSGKASVTSPTILTVKDGQAYAHFKQVGGIEIIGLGSDFDGIGGKLELSDCSKNRAKRIPVYYFLPNPSFPLQYKI